MLLFVVWTDMEIGVIASKNSSNDIINPMHMNFHAITLHSRTVPNILISYNRYIKHSGSSGGWEERTKLREKVTLKFTIPTLPIMPTAVTIKLIKLGSCNFT